MCAKDCTCKDCLETINTSDINFNGEFNNIVVPEGADLNDVLLLIEGYVDNQIDGVADLTFVLADPNPIGLEPGTYSYVQILEAIITTLNSNAESIDDHESRITTLESTDNNYDDRLDEIELLVVPDTERYKAKVSQLGTSAPNEQDTALINQLGGTWSYSSVGNYYFTATGKFTDETKVFVQFTNSFSGTNSIAWGVDNDDRLLFVTKDETGTNANFIMSNMCIVIEVLP